MPRLIGLDFETYGAVNLPRHGLARYVRDPFFQPLIASLAWENDYQIDRYTLDFTAGLKQPRRELQTMIGAAQIVAHNAPFEQAVLTWLGIDYPSSRFIDSAVVARAAGAAGKLEAAAPQLLGIDKMFEGKGLIKLFSIGEGEFNPDLVRCHPGEWALFKHYCERDAELGLRLVLDYLAWLGPDEMDYQAITMDMDRVGWPVDLAAAEEMQRRYLENLSITEEEFRSTEVAADLNLASLKQLKEWCGKRGVKAKSFDKAHVESMIKALTKKLDLPSLTDVQRIDYGSVLHMLHTKQALGGSSLKKLAVLLDTLDSDSRLRDQYVHGGAGQSMRTSGRSVQMQNLKRLSEVADMDELEDMESVWNNGRLADNMRQLFTASQSDGQLIVGDFKSVESRGLAWLAGAEWKLREFRSGRDMYKVQAATMYHVSYDMVHAEQRQNGKVGELMCGYNAGREAVQSFAAGMGIEMSETEAAKLVFDWRQANPEIVAFWQRLDEMLRETLAMGRPTIHYLADGLVLRFSRVKTPESLGKQHPGCKSVRMEICVDGGRVLMRRYFLGCYNRGRDIGYYRPAERKTGDLWKNHFTDLKTKQVIFNKLYGGKICAVLTQSLCREIFFGVLKEVHRWCQQHSGQVRLVGQFHDEIVLDWKPGALSLDETKSMLAKMMSDPGWFTSFPLEADVKSDYRYIK